MTEFRFIPDVTRDLVDQGPVSLQDELAAALWLALKSIAVYVAALIVFYLISPVPSGGVEYGPGGSYVSTNNATGVGQ